MISSSQRGFTLVEILIAIAVMAALTTFTAQSLQSALRSSTKYRRQIDETAELRDVMRIIEKDINVAFHYRDVHYEMTQSLDEKKEGDGNNEAQQQQTEDGKAPPPNYTAFQGDTNALNFTALANVRTLVDVKESDQAEIGYFLRTCNSRGNKKKTSSCLWRRLSPIIDKEIEEGGRAIVLIENVKTFSLRYMGEPEENQEPEWADTWFSGENADPTTKDKFPAAVEITLEVNRTLGEKTVVQKLSTIAAVRFPNNKVEKEADGSTTEGGENEN